MTIRRIVVFLICVWITACGPSTTPTPTTTPPAGESPDSTGTLPITFGPFLTPTPNDAPLIPPEIATAQAAEENDDSGEVEPTSTPIPTAAPTIFDVELPYLQDGGALPPGALGRIGIGEINDISLINDNKDVLLGTSTGMYAYQIGSFSRSWRRYYPHYSWEMSTSPDGTRTVANFLLDRSPILYDTQTGNRVADLDGWHGGHWSPDSTKVAVEERPSYSIIEANSFTGRIHLYNGLNGELLRDLEIELRGFYGIVFSDIIWSPDGTYVAARQDFDNTVYIWNALNGRFLYTISTGLIRDGRPLGFIDFDFSPDSKYLVGIDMEKLTILDLNSGEIVLDEKGEFDSMEWTGEDLVFTDYNSLSIFNLSTLEEIDRFDINLKQYVDITVSPSGAQVVANLDEEGSIVIGLPSFETQFQLPRYVGDIHWSPDEEWLVGYDWQDESYLVFDTVTGESPFPPFSITGGLYFVDDSTMLAIDRLNVLLLDLNSGELINGFQSSLDMDWMGWSPDGQLLLLDRKDNFWGWSEETGELNRIEPAPLNPLALDLESVQPFDWKESEMLSLSPDGLFKAEVLEELGCGDGPWGGGCGAWSSDFTLKRSDGETEQTVISFHNSGTGIYTFAWSPDGSMLALGEAGRYTSGIHNYEIIILDTQTGDELFRFEGHLGNVNTLIFSPDGTRLASASNDDTVIIWNTAR